MGLDLFLPFDLYYTVILLFFHSPVLVNASVQAIHVHTLDANVNLQNACSNHFGVAKLAVCAKKRKSNLKNENLHVLAINHLFKV